MPGALPNVGGLTVFISTSDDEAEIVAADVGFGAKGFVAADVEAGFAVNMLVDAVAGLAENMLDVFDPSLGANRFEGDGADGLRDVEASLGTKRLEV